IGGHRYRPQGDGLCRAERDRRSRLRLAPRQCARCARNPGTAERVHPQPVESFWRPGQGYRLGHVQTGGDGGAAQDLSGLRAAVRDFAEKGVAQAKDAYVKFKVAADETSDLLEGAYSSTSKGLSALGQKALETARSNANASFDHALSLLSVKTLSDVIEINT